MGRVCVESNLKSFTGVIERHEERMGFLVVSGNNDWAECLTITIELFLTLLFAVGAEAHAADIAILMSLGPFFQRYQMSVGQRPTPPLLRTIAPWRRRGPVSLQLE